MTKQEQIEEMVGVMAASNNPFVDVPIEIMPQVAKALYNAGYRKSEEVRKETAKDIYEKAEFVVNATSYLIGDKKYLHLDALKEIVNIICGEEVKE